MKKACKRCKKPTDCAYLTCSVCRCKSREYKEKNKAACAIVVKLWKQRNWHRRVCCHAMDNDRKADRLPSDMSEYVNPPYVKSLRVYQENQCAYCDIDMQVENRKEHDGLTLQRMAKGIGHTKANCLLACFSCNVHRVESGNSDFLDEKRRIVYFEKLMNEGYAKLTNRRSSFIM